MISIKGENLEYAQMLLGNAPKQIQWAAVRAINRTVTSVKANVSKKIRQNYTIKAPEVKKTLAVRRADGRRLRGAVVSHGRPLLLTAFDVRTYKRGPIGVKVRKQKDIRRVPGLFLGTSRTGYVGAMQRTQRARYPLRVPYGPSVPQMFGSADVISELIPLAEKTLNKRFLHEVEYRFSKMQ